MNPQWITQRWAMVLTTALGGCYLLVAADAGGIVRWGGIASAAGIIAAPWIATRTRAAATALLVLGAVPFAAATWWSAVTPMVGVLALVTGFIAIQEMRSTTGSRRRAELAATPSPDGRPGEHRPIKE